MSKRVRAKVDKPKLIWRKWEHASFKEAHEADRPILLYLSAVWCHSCHVMDSTCYLDHEIIRAINDYFIPIRVDIDKRPDIAERYNFGGYPTIAFVAPTGEIITGGTYVPPKEMLNLLKSVYAGFKRNRETIKANVAQAEKIIESVTRKEPKELHEDIIWAIAETVLGNFDTVYAGLGREPKFPYPEALDFCLLLYKYTGDRGYLLITTKTLDRMQNSEIYDSAEGGFFRYAMARDWTAPQYEKMLDNNASIVRNYIHAYQLTQDKNYEATAMRSLEYILTRLRDPKGFFYGSQDAEAEYYKLPPGERTKRTPPKADQTLYTNWNAMTVSTLIEAAATFRERKYLPHALNCLDFMLDKVYKKGAGAFHYFDGKPGLPNMHNDQVYFAHALLDAYEASGNRKYLQAALDVQDFTDSKLWDKDGGGYYDKPPDPEEFGYLKNGDKGIIENSLAARLLDRLAIHANRAEYSKQAETALRLFSDTFSNADVFASEFAISLYRHLRKPIEISIIGKQSDPATSELVLSSFATFEPRRVIIVLDPETEKGLIAKRGWNIPDRPIAYVCVEEQCSPELDDAHALIKTINEFTIRKT